MAKILLHHADGRYSTRLLFEKEAAEIKAQGGDIVTVQDRVYVAYLQHCAQDDVYQTLWNSLANEQYLRRRERELMPLEEAQREIQRLKDELESSKRLHRYFEDEWLRATGGGLHL